jgi:hypothetical protein
MDWRLLGTPHYIILDIRETSDGAAATKITRLGDSEMCGLSMILNIEKKQDADNNDRNPCSVESVHERRSGLTVKQLDCGHKTRKLYFRHWVTLFERGSIEKPLKRAWDRIPKGLA